MPQLSRSMGTVSELLMLGNPLDSSDSTCAYLKSIGLGPEDVGVPEWEARNKRFGSAQAAVRWETDAVVQAEHIPTGDLPCLLLAACGSRRARSHVLIPPALATTDHGLRSLSDALHEGFDCKRISERLLPLDAMSESEAAEKVRQYGFELQSQLRIRAAIVERERPTKDLTAIDRKILRLLAKDPASFLLGREIAKRLGCERGTISGNLADLSKRGYLEQKSRKGYRIKPRGLSGCG